MCKTELFIIIEPSIFPYQYTIKLMLEYTKPYQTIIPLLIKTNIIDFPDIITPKIMSEIEGWECINLCFSYKSTYIYYNEIYHGWGAEDTDYNCRKTLKGDRFIFCPFTKFIHVNHPKLNRLRNDKDTERNRSLLKQLLNLYIKRKIITIEKNTSEEHIFCP